MLWMFILIAILVGAAVHSTLASRGGRGGRTVELFLVYLLAGYYGLAMILAGIVHLFDPQAIAQLKGRPCGGQMGNGAWSS